MHSCVKHLQWLWQHDVRVQKQQTKPEKRIKYTRSDDIVLPIEGWNTADSEIVYNMQLMVNEIMADIKWINLLCIPFHLTKFSE